LGEYVYKTEFINPSQRGSQFVSSALIIQDVNPNGMDVVNIAASARIANVAVEGQAANGKFFSATFF